MRLQESSRRCDIFDLTRDDATEAEDDFYLEVLLITVPSTALISTGGEEGHTPGADDPVRDVIDIIGANVTVPAAGHTCRVDDDPDDEDAMQYPAMSVCEPNTSGGHATAGTVSMPIEVKEVVHIQAANVTTPSSTEKVEHRHRAGAMYEDGSPDVDKLQASSIGEC